jgi:hypothetical protein
MPPGTRIDYRQFGQNLLDRVITTKRVNDLVHAAIGEHVELAYGVVNIKFTATSTVNRFDVVADKAPELGFAIAVTIGFELDGKILWLVPDNYKGSIELLTDAHIQTIDPLTLFIDLTPFDKDSVKVTIEGEDLPGDLTEGIVQERIRDQVIKGANQFLGDTAARTFDLTPLVDRAVEQLGSQ